jgi:hypothetical protein
MLRVSRRFVEFQRSSHSVIAFIDDVAVSNPPSANARDWFPGGH